ncbi:FkbM family methyltransferase [Tautonia marina]|uniref:FkbM family methyltransferase n=1 Tax=Tautonia marina TaxID=2653855 RepID=UPI001260656A|nr:FkbM family methyltransferase [Tautonia marina]
MSVKSKVVEGVLKQFRRQGLQITRLPFPNDHPLNLLTLLADRIPHTGADFSLVQIGANDGVSNDPVHDLIIERGWSALLVEPLTDAFDRLKKTYENVDHVQCVNCAIGHTDGTMTLWRVAEAPGSPASRCTSFSRAVLAKQYRSIPNLESRIQPIEVPSFTLQTLLERCKVGRIDLLQIDTEGFDFEVIKMMFSTPIRPGIINFENNHLSYDDKVACARMLREQGYRYLSFGRDTTAFRTEGSVPA